MDLVILVFPGNIFGGLSQLDVAAVGHLTAMLTATAAVALILARRRRGQAGGEQAPGEQARAQAATWPTPTAMPIR